jgi:hypothetical protein
MFIPPSVECVEVFHWFQLNLSKIWGSEVDVMKTSMLCHGTIFLHTYFWVMEYLLQKSLALLAKMGAMYGAKNGGRLEHQLK